MLRSMTAFGRASLSHPLGRFTVEIQTVNRKYLEVVASLPPELVIFEVDVKKWIAESVGRGSLVVRIGCTLGETFPLHVEANLPLVRQIRLAARSIAEECGLSEVETLTRELVARNKDVLSFMTGDEEVESYREVLHQAVTGALSQLIVMKEAEGKVIEADILKRLNILEQGIGEIQTLAPQAVERLKSKLQEKMEAVLPGALENEERLLREVCVYSEKLDVTEEIVRFNHHIDQVRHLLRGEGLASGKKIDFTMQELNREITTIASKASEVQISQQVVNIKSEIERIREQIQNVE